MKILILLLFTTILFSQNSIVTAGNQTETFGENITRMQTFDTIVEEVSLGTPTFELPEPPKPIIKKNPKTFLEKLIEFFKNLINKNK